MASDPATIRTLALNDLRLLVRSPRTIVLSVLLPIAVLPLMFFVQARALEQQRERADEHSYRFVLFGPEADAARPWIERARELAAQAAPVTAPTPAAGAAPGAVPAKPLTLVEEAADAIGDPRRALDEEKIDFYLEALSAAGAVARLTQQAQRDGSTLDPEQLPAATTLFVGHRGDRESSREGAERITELLERARLALRMAVLHDRGFAVPQDQVLPVELVDAASQRESSGARIGRFVTVLVLLMLLAGGSVVAMDTLAGEKERGTLETVLTTAASRTDIVLAKGAAVLIVALAITAIQILSLLIWVGLDLLPAGSASIAVTPAIALLLLVLYLPLAALAAAVLLLVSGTAKTYKEAQLLFFPVYLLMAAPALAPVLPGIELRSAIVLLPIANLAIGVRDVLSGTLSGATDWLFLLVAWLVNGALAAYLGTRAVRTLQNERLITTSELDEADLRGGPRLLARRVLRWYAVLWAVLLVWQTNLTAATNIRVAVAVNMTLMVATALGLLYRYRVGPRAALSLRLPRWPVWLAVGFGAPAGVVVGGLVGRASSLFFEIPDELLERFSEQLLPQGMSTASLLLFLAVLPGVCEELTFRGTLLYGLRLRLSPWRSILLSAAIFGLFHVTLYRLLPTAFLGVVLAVLTVWSGSILPAMVWHALNNASAIVLDRAASGALEQHAWIVTPAAVGLFALAAIVVWRFRDPAWSGQPASQAPAVARGELAA